MRKKPLFAEEDNDDIDDMMRSIHHLMWYINSHIAKNEREKVSDCFFLTTITDHAPYLVNVFHYRVLAYGRDLKRSIKL